MAPCRGSWQDEERTRFVSEFARQYDSLAGREKEMDEASKLALPVPEGDEIARHRALARARKAETRRMRLAGKRRGAGKQRVAIDQS